jgi:hypothetical protein
MVNILRRMNMISTWSTLNNKSAQDFVPLLPQLYPPLRRYIYPSDEAEHNDFIFSFTKGLETPSP